VLTDQGNLGWPVVLGCTLGATLLWVGIATLSDSAAILLPIGLPLLIGGAYVLYQAALRKHWALLTLMILGLTLLSVTFRRREVGSPGLDWQVGLKVLAWMAMFGVFAVNISRLRLFCADRVLMAILCLCLLIDLSTACSVAPEVTGPAAFAVTAFLGFSCLLANEIPERTLILSAFWAMSFICLVNALSPLLAPSMAFGHDDAELIMATHGAVMADMRLQGFFGQPNIMARYVSVFLVFVLAVAYRGYVTKLVWIPNAVLAVGLLLSTQSRGTLLAVAAGAFSIIPRRLALMSATLGVVGGVAVLVSGQTDTILALVGRNGDASEALDMAGRADLWQFVWGLIKQRPLLGYGFNSFEVYAGRLWTGQVGAGVAAHNNFLSMLYTNGVLGTIPFVAGFLMLLRRWITEPDPARDFFVISTLVFSYSEIDMPSFAFVPSQLFFTMLALDAKKRILPPGPAGAHNRGPVTALIHQQEAVP